MPQDGWAAAGLLLAAERSGDAATEAGMRALLARSWFGPALPSIDRF
jgi:hypothetical protein